MQNRYGASCGFVASGDIFAFSRVQQPARRGAEGSRGLAVVAAVAVAAAAGGREDSGCSAR
jgi:hypothetical protein